MPGRLGDVLWRSFVGDREGFGETLGLGLGDCLECVGDTLGLCLGENSDFVGDQCVNTVFRHSWCSCRYLIQKYFLSLNLMNI